ncbi:MAG: hypothetical protein J5699_09075 [Bacteroidales bacterium]|nr:hypothetical protein [Bacteroidales bacterium]
MKQLVKVLLFLLCCSFLSGCFSIDNYSYLRCSIINRCSDTLGVKTIGVAPNPDISGLVRENQLDYFKPESGKCIYSFSWEYYDTVDYRDHFNDIFAAQDARIEIYDKNGILLRCWKESDKDTEPDNIFNIDNWRVSHSNHQLKKLCGEVYGEQDEFYCDYFITPEMLGLKE